MRAKTPIQLRTAIFMSVASLWLGGFLVVILTPDPPKVDEPTEVVTGGCCNWTTVEDVRFETGFYYWFEMNHDRSTFSLVRRRMEAWER